MEESIFEAVTKQVEANPDLLSFKDCPNKCIDGYYIDPYRHKKMRCEYCANKRKELITESIHLKGNESVNDKLRLPRSFTGYGTFDLDTIISPQSQKRLTPESVSEVSEKLSSLLNDISVGIIPEYSICFNLGYNSSHTNFIYTYLIRAYLNGLTTTPFLTDLDVYRLRQDIEILDKTNRSFQDFTLDDIINKDVCIIVITSCATTSSVYTVKGLMQLRAYKDKSTIIFTELIRRDIVTLLNEFGVESKNLATGYSVKYIEKTANQEKVHIQNHNINNSGASLSQKSFAEMISSVNNL